MKSSINHTFLCILAAALLLPVTSCMKGAGEPEEAVDVRFSVWLPQQMDTRALSDGRSAVDLHFRVYKVTESGVVYLPSLSQDIPNAFVNLRAELTTHLVRGFTYNFVFWAQSGDAASAFDLSGLAQSAPCIGVDYTPMTNSNETFDAFCSAEMGYVVTGSADISQVLSRPFAQINFGTAFDDWADASDAGVDLTLTAMSFKGAYTRYYPFTGEVSDPVNVAFIPAAIPAEPLVVEKQEYKWLSMDYVLVPAGKSITDVSLTLKTNTQDVNTITVPNVPVQRNYRTNILGGRLITTNTKIVIVIDPVYVDDYNVNY